MSPFWKNVNDELLYQGMNLKTLASLTGIPYTTITNGRNRPDSIPTADIAMKIANVLHKPLERLLCDDFEPSVINGNNEENARKLRLFKKYEDLLCGLEKCSIKTQEAFVRLVCSICEQE